MKNLKVSIKLIVSFSIVIILAICLAEMGLWGMQRVKNASDEMYEFNVVAVDAIGLIRENFANQRYITRELIIYSPDTPQYQARRETLRQLDDQMDQYIALYESTIQEDEDSALFEQFKALYYDEFIPYKVSFVRFTDQDQIESIMDYIKTEGEPLAEEILSLLNKGHAYNTLQAQKALEQNTTLYQTMERIEITLLVVVVLIVMGMVIYLWYSISKPLTVIANTLGAMGKSGNLELDDEVMQRAQRVSARRDEIGTASSAVVHLLRHIWSIEQYLTRISNGDFDLEVKMLSERDTLGMSVAKVKDNLNRLFQSLKDAEEAAQTASKAKGAFLAHISHEIRTPLNAITGMAEIARSSDKDTGKILACVEQILVSSRHLLSLLNDVLDMSKIESGKLELTHEPFPLDEALAEVSGIISQSCLNKDIRFVMDTDDVNRMVLIGDKMRLNQVLINLLGNAVKFTDQGGEITLRIQTLKASDDQVTLRYTVSDNGIGMSEEQVSKLFRPFEQTNSSIAAKYGGTGLGLSICRSIVTMMGGTITVDSTEGQGTAFSFDITNPRMPEKYGTEDKTETLMDLRGRRFLLAEDVELNRIIFCHLLGNTGMMIDQAEDGQQAVELFTRSPPGYYDMIIMDVQMPLLDGYQATQQIRALDRPDAQTVPILAMTAGAYKEDVERCLAAGMNGHTTKPIEYRTVLEKISTLLSQNNP